MNSTSQKLAARIRELFIDGKWIANTNFQDQLRKLNWVQANTRLHDLNTVALLTFHVNYYLSGVLQVLNGGKLEIRDKFSFDMPPLNGEAEWQQRIDQLVANAEAFAKALEQLSDETLLSGFVKPEYGTYERNIEGILEHSYYHLGQVSLISKMVRAQSGSN